MIDFHMSVITRGFSKNYMQSVHLVVTEIIFPVENVRALVSKNRTFCLIYNT